MIVFKEQFVLQSNVTRPVFQIFIIAIQMLAMYDSVAVLLALQSLFGFRKTFKIVISIKIQLITESLTIGSRIYVLQTTSINLYNL